MDFFKKTGVLALLLFVLILCRDADAGTPFIQAESAVLINGRTGEVLWEKDAHRVLHPASTTKILTTVLLLENALPDELAVTSARAAATPGSSLYLSEGQQISVLDMQYAIMLQSANDAAVVAAEHLAGSVDAFAVMMNQKARQAGAINTNFTNPHGLTEPDHLTTAYDLAMIARYAMTNPRFRELAVTTRHTMPWPGAEKRTIYNKNPMLSGYEGMTGIKAGYTVEARRTFVGAAQRDGMELIAVVLGSEGTTVWDDTVALLDLGFTGYSSLRPVEEGEILGTVPIRFGGPILVRAAADFEFTRPIGDVDVSTEVSLQPGRSAPVSEGDVLGDIIIYADGEQVGAVELLAAESVSRAAVATGRFWFFSGIFVLGGLRFRKVIRRRRKRRKIIRRKKDSRYLIRKSR
ncbi:MAG: D-alanyl-D-alanine carboxypeptidase family protein [Bacillota bacterium]|nr:D-alanyl-D-alanine carboxypeptidase family protein [Bacillota bacterium]MDW7683097.1 D-alanyl-D-alanine carboxypeptidase family protein [Bacillota bacterium]